MRRSTAPTPYALRQACDTAYAALTLDLQLPEQRGLELLGSIRSHGASHASPVIGIDAVCFNDGRVTEYCATY
jgi:DNA-binding response OmpR family regulator